MADTPGAEGATTEFVLPEGYVAEAAQRVFAAEGMRDALLTDIGLNLYDKAKSQGATPGQAMRWAETILGAIHQAVADLASGQA